MKDEATSPLHPPFTSLRGEASPPFIFLISNFSSFRVIYKVYNSKFDAVDIKVSKSYRYFHKSSLKKY